MSKLDMKKRKLMIWVFVVLAILVIGGGFIRQHLGGSSFGINIDPNFDMPTITEQELACGSYYGMRDQKKPGTPDDWIWGDAGRSSLWHDPDEWNHPMKC
jgi:hypothetical protein